MFDAQMDNALIPSTPPKLVRATPEASPQSSHGDENVKKALAGSLGGGIMAYEPRLLRGSRASRRSRRSRLARAGLMKGQKTTNDTEYSTDGSFSDSKDQDFESEVAKQQVKNSVHRWSPKRFIRRRNSREQDHQNSHDESITENMDEANVFNEEKTESTVDIVGSPMEELVSNETESEAQFNNEPSEKMIRSTVEPLDDVDIDGTSLESSAQGIPDKIEAHHTVLIEEQPRMIAQDITTGKDEKATTHKSLADSVAKDPASESQGQASKRMSTIETTWKEDDDDDVSKSTKCSPKSDGQSASTSAGGKPYRWIKVGTVHWVKQGTEEVFDTKCKTAKASANETPPIFFESQHVPVLDTPEVTERADINEKNVAIYETTEVSKADERSARRLNLQIGDILSGSFHIRVHSGLQ